MGIFDNGPIDIHATRYPVTPRRVSERVRSNVTVIRATRVADGEVFEFHGWAEVERLGFDRMSILSSLIPAQHGSCAYQPSRRPYNGFRWAVIGPKDHPIPCDTYQPIY